MELVEQFRERIAAISTYDGFEEVAAQLWKLEQVAVFRLLWSLSLGSAADECSEMASRLLVETHPDPDRDLDGLISEVHSSELDASNRMVPFYLISQFGRAATRAQASVFLQSLEQGAPRSRVDSVQYWSTFPAARLCEPLHRWEFEDMHGIGDGA